jgi:hypothetical protein
MGWLFRKKGKADPCQNVNVIDVKLVKPPISPSAYRQRTLVLVGPGNREVKDTHV